LNRKGAKVVTSFTAVHNQESEGNGCVGLDLKEESGSRSLAGFTRKDLAYSRDTIEVQSKGRW